VPGVSNVDVSFENKTAVVTYDDSKAQLDALVKATTNAGDPSAPKSWTPCKSLIAADVVAVVTVVCCAARPLVAAIGAAGLTAWLA
jgi:hypothetical protein